MKISNNKYINCPARMDDGRAFTDYRQNCTLENNIQFDNKIKNSYEYRQFLINNGLKIMDINKENSFINNGCEKKNVPIPSFKTFCDINTNNVYCKLNDEKGIGVYYNDISNLNKNNDTPVKPYDPYLKIISNKGMIMK